MIFQVYLSLKKLDQKFPCTMKKLLLFTPIIVIVLTLPSLADDCPSVPKETTEVTVKDSKATLRTEPKKSSEKGSRILAEEKLKVIDVNPTKDSGGNDYCWYKVKLANGQNEKEFWIASIGLKEFSSWPKDTDSTSNSSNSSKKNQSNKPLTSWLIWLWLLPIIPTVILGVLLFEKKSEKRGFRRH